MARKISLRMVWSVARTEWIKWVCSSRMILIPVLAVFTYTFAIEPLMERSRIMEQPLNLVEPLVAVGNSGMLTLILPLVFLTLMSDFPKLDGSAIFMLSRTGRTNWMLGQLMFGIMSVFSFLGSVYVICTAFIMNKTFVANGWSMVVKQFDALYPDMAGGFASELIPGNLHNQMTPFAALGHTLALMSLYLLTLLLILLLFQQKKKKAAGFLTAAGVIGFGVVLTALKGDAMWITPMANAIVWLHYDEILREANLPTYISYVYFAVLTVALFTANVAASRNLNFNAIEEMEV